MIKNLKVKKGATSTVGQRPSCLFWLLLIASLTLLGLIFSIPGVKNLIFVSLYGFLPKESSFNTLYAVEAQIMVFVTVVSIISSFYTVHQSVSTIPNILKEYVGTKRVWVTFAFQLFTLFVILGCLAISYSGFFWSAFSSIFLLTSLVMLVFHFSYTMKFVDPVREVNRISAQTVSEIGKIPRQLEAAAAQQKSETEKSNMPNKLYKCLLLQKDDAIYGKIMGSTSEMFNLIQRTAAKRESETYSVALSSLADSAITYIQTCREYIVIKDKFTEYVFEQLNSLAQIAMRNGDSILLGKVVATYEKISLATVDVGVVFMPGESLYLTTVASQYFRQLATQAKNINFLDSCGQALRIMGKISEASIERCGDYALAIETFDNIIRIANQSLDEGEWFATSVAVETLSRLLTTSIKNTYQRTIIELEMDKIDFLSKNVIRKLHPNIANTLLSQLYAPVTREISPYNFTRIVKTIFEAQKSTDNGAFIETDYHETYKKKIVSATVHHLHSFGVNAAELNNLHLFQDISDTLYEIGRCCLNVKFTNPSNQFEDEIEEIMNAQKDMYLKLRFPTGMKNDNPTTIPDALIILGCEALKKEKYRAAITSINNLFELAVRNRKTNEPDDAAVTADKIQLMGIYALQRAEETQKNEDYKSEFIAKMIIKALRDFDKEQTPNLPPRSSTEDQQQRFMKEENEQSQTQHLFPNATIWFHNNLKREAFTKFKEFETSQQPPETKKPPKSARISSAGGVGFIE